MGTFIQSRIDILEVDANVKNKFKFEWLSDKDCNGDFYSDYIRKPKEPGLAFCLHCRDTINYGSAGKRCLVTHAKTQKHATSRNIKLTNQTLSVVFQGAKAATDSLPYGVAPNINTGSAGNVSSTPGQPNVCTIDRRANAEATLLSFVAEHNLSLSMIPALIEFAQEMARDSAALNALHMSRPCGTYKLTDGLAPALKKKLVFDLQRYAFSINLDECTSNANKRVLTVLVSYYSEEAERVVVQHYVSVEMIYVNAQSVYQIVTEALEKDGIPANNLVSTLSDSAGYMRGSKSGFETLLRVKLPHLLDIGGDTCHDIHNIVKNFCGHFGKYLESFLDDIHVDLKYSPDLENYLRDICSALEINFLKPRQRIAHRWLSVYDCSLPVSQMLSALTLLYWAWLPEEEYSQDLKKLYAGLLPVSENGKKLVKEIHTECRLKNMTSDGKERKKRIVRKILSNRAKTMLLLNMYISCLKKFKKYIEIFQRNEPMMHQIYDRQQVLLKWFLTCFLDAEKVNQKEHCLTKFNVKDTSFHLPTKRVYMGNKAKAVYKSLDKKNNVREEFMETLKKAYVETAEYMQKKLSTSDVVKQMSALDPKACGYTVTHCELLNLLMDNFRHALSEEEQDDYGREIRSLQVDSNLPKMEKGMRLDAWWTHIFHTQDYPCLSKVVKMCLSIFTSPQVEQSFSQMNAIVTTTTNRMDTRTYAALQTVRYYLKTKEAPQNSKKRETVTKEKSSKEKEKDSASLRVFHREDVRKDPVDSVVCRHLLTAHMSYFANKQDKAIEKENEKKKSSCRKNPAKDIASKRKKLELISNKPDCPPKKK